MPTTDDYVDLITPFHATRPKFTATVAASVTPLAGLQAALAGLVGAFDLDDALGAQLDIDGQWIGRSRQVPIPVQNAFFAWGDPLRGWGRGVWKGPYATGITLSSLDDDTYRRLLRAKILANHWDGTIAGQQAILDAYFIGTGASVIVVDTTRAITPKTFFAWGTAGQGWGQGAWRQASEQQAAVPNVNLSQQIVVSGALPSIVDLELLNQNLVAAKPQGVSLDVMVTTKNNTPVFGFGPNSAQIAGWGIGSWAASPDYVATHAT